LYVTKYAGILRFEVRSFGKEVHKGSSPGKSGTISPLGGRKEEKEKKLKVSDEMKVVNGF
jgi:hypothetical protein